MKNLFALGLVALVLGCGKSESGGDGPSGSCTGIESRAGCMASQGSSLTADELTAVLPSTPWCGVSNGVKEVTHFLANGTFNATAGTNVLSGHWKVTGLSTVVFDFDQIPGKTMTSTILKLSDSPWKLRTISDSGRDETVDACSG